MVPTEPTIVFAGVNERSFVLLEKARVDALMTSFMILGKSKKLKAQFNAPSWPTTTYLDSGVFTFMRRAGVAYQNRLETTQSEASWDEFKSFASTFRDYIRENKQYWNWIVELDVDELYGVERADQYRKVLRGIVGERLLPVWHAQRGLSGWSEMVRDFPYICLSPTKAFNRGKGADRLVESMLKEAHDNGCRVHILGVENIKWFELGADSFDASSWSSGARWGQFKLSPVRNGATNVIVPTMEKQKVRRPISHHHIEQLKDIIAEYGFTLEDMRKEGNAKEVGIYLLQKRQEEARARNIAKAAS